MKWYLLIFIPALACIGMGACSKQKRYSDTPYIEFKGSSPDSLRAGASEDTLFISFRFTDGDADLGNDPASGNYDIFLTDQRDNTIYTYFFPNIPDIIRNPEKGMEGTCTFFLLAAFMILRPDRPDGDTARYSLYIKDRAGNQSNTIYTNSVYIYP